MFKFKKNKNINKPKHSKDKSKKKSILKYVLNGFLWVIILGFIFYGGLKIIDSKTGYKILPNHSAVIVSESMSYVNEANYSYLDKDVTHIKINDIVYTSNYGSFDDVKKLDVIIYLDSEGNLICHRVVDKYIFEDVQYVVTRGDANNTNDAPVRYDLVRGRVYAVTGGGNIVLFFQSPYFILALCGCGFSILLGYIIYDINIDKKKKTAVQLDKKGNEKKKNNEK